MILVHRDSKLDVVEGRWFVGQDSRQRNVNVRASCLTRDFFRTEVIDLCHPIRIHNLPRLESGLASCTNVREPMQGIPHKDNRARIHHRIRPYASTSRELSSAKLPETHWLSRIDEHSTMPMADKCLMPLDELKGNSKRTLRFHKSR